MKSSLKKFFLVVPPIWKLFFGFLFSTTVLAICPWPWGWAALPGVLSLLLAFSLPDHWFGLKGFQSFKKKEILPPIPHWAWFFLAVGVVWVRFFDLTTLSGWPINDDAWVSYFALNSPFKAHHPIFFGGSKIPPLYIWGQALVYRFFSPSLKSHWAFPAALSALPALGAYLAVRDFFGRSLALLFFLGMGFAFWPMYIGRFSNPGVALLPFEMLVVWIGLRALNYGDDKRSRGWFFFLGLATGLGFYVFASWMGIALVITVMVLAAEAARGRWTRSVSFVAGLLLTLGPIIFDIRVHGFTSHIEQVSLWSPQLRLEDRLESSAGFLAGLFSPIPSGLCYWSNWGGMMNPIEGALFCLGLRAAFRGKNSGWVRWPFTAGGVLLLPGLLSGTTEMYRTVPMIPVLVFYGALGSRSLLETVRPNKILGLLLLLVSVSLGINLYHLKGPYHREWGTQRFQIATFKSLESWQAYEKLEAIWEKDGPGIILTGLAPLGSDTSLELMTWRMDPRRNPALKGDAAKWFAVIANVHMAAALKENYPESHWFNLSQKRGRMDGVLALGVFQTGGKNGALLERLLPAEEGIEIARGDFFKRAVWLSDSMAENIEPVLRKFRKDRLVRGFLDRNLGFEFMKENRYDLALKTFQEGMVSGVRGADLEYLSSLCAWNLGDSELAKKYYGLARSSNPDFTGARFFTADFYFNHLRELDREK